MSTLSAIHTARMRVPAHFDLSRLRTILGRLVTAWKSYRQARAGALIDRYFRRERNEHERFLSKASDHYELERLERAWERRHADVWRVY
jgi:hypothetical protein